MWPDWVSNPGPLTYKSGALQTALCDLAILDLYVSFMFARESYSFGYKMLFSIFIMSHVIGLSEYLLV